MDVSEWREDARRTYPKRLKQIDYIFKAIGEFPRVYTEQPPTITEAEIDAGLLIAWKSPAGIKFLLSPAEQEVLERGVHPWPRGNTRLLDQICKVLDANLRGKDGDREVRAILDRGPIARQRAADVEAALKAERRAAKKRKTKRG